MSSAGGPRSLVMVQLHLEQLPPLSVPQGFRLRYYEPGDEAHWLRIHEKSDVYNRFSSSTFATQFGTDGALLRQRQIYLEDCTGWPVATATAWHGNPDGVAGDVSWGRLHWVAVLPENQGRGLGRVLVTVCLNRMHQLGHQQAYLTTREDRVAAVKLYEAFGFVPRV